MMKFKHAVLATLPGIFYLSPAVANDAPLELYGVVEVRSVSRSDVDHDTYVDAARLGALQDRQLGSTQSVRGRWQVEFDLPVNGPATDSTDSGDVSTRKALVSLKGRLGEVIFGRQNNILADTKKMDQFKNDSGVFLQGPDRLGNALSYVTPTAGGVHGYVHVASDVDAEEPASDADATVFGLNYRTENFYAGLSKLDVDEEFDSGEVDLFSAGASYTFGNFTLFGTYQSEDVTGTDYFGLGAAYTLEDWTFKVASASFDNDADEEGSATFLLADRALGKHASAFIQYVDYDSDAESIGYGDAVSVGVALSFSKVF